MTQKHHTHQFTRTEEAITVLFCLIDDAYANLNPRGRRYESLKRLSDSEVITLALFQQLRGIESERSFLRDAERFFSHLFPAVIHFFESWTAYDTVASATLSAIFLMFQYFGPGMIKSVLTLRTGNAWVHVWAYHAIAPHVTVDTTNIVNVFRLR